jgi:hypothetical protein
VGSGLLRRTPLIALLLAISSYALFLVAGWLIAADRGLDITDETMYLLSATSDATWMAPFGWHTKPLLRVCGGDIACFRSAGFTVLFAASLALTVSVFRAAFGDKKVLRPPALVSQFFLAFGATLLFYTGFLSRTPSYNWVNAVGILVTAAAHVQLLGDRQRIHRFVPSGLEWAAAAGIFFSAAGKPSSPLLLLLLFAALCAYSSSLRYSLLSAGRQVVAVGLLFVVSIIARFWPNDFASIFQHLLTAPRAPTALGEAQTPVGAADKLLRSLGNAVSQAWTYAVSPRFGPLLVVLALTAWLRRHIQSRLAGAVFLTTLVLVLSAVLVRITTPENLFYGSGAVFRAWIALLLAFGVIRVVGLTRDRAKCSDPTLPHTSTGGCRATVVLYLLALPAIFSFGSSNGLEVMFALFPLPGILVLMQLAAVEDRLIQGAMHFALVFSVVMIGMLSRSAALESPYRSAPIASDLRTTELLGSKLLVEPQLAELIFTMQSDSRDAGFGPGTNLVSLDWEWQSFNPVALGATPPATMVTTQYTDLELFRHNAKRFSNPAFLDHAWVTVTPIRQIPDGGQPAVNAVIAEFEALAGREFPESYRCVGDYGITQVWRPKTVSEPVDINCPDRGPFPYLLDRGYVGPSSQD